VKNRFQSLPFKCNLQRYISLSLILAVIPALRSALGPLLPGGAGYKFNAVDR
jgi:hypothetical protein